MQDPPLASSRSPAGDHFWTGL